VREKMMGRAKRVERKNYEGERNLSREEREIDS
jgi:hypothetical protein